MTASGSGAVGSGPMENIAAGLLALGVVAGIVSLFYLPFLFSPIGFLAVLIGSANSSRDRRIGLFATLIVSLCFLVGASIAIWQSNPLY